ncbi:MAG: gas vesicle protein K [Chloroflexi bacterium]|nr:gas vesicle protein K [Chloroflexota bacterium]
MKLDIAEGDLKTGVLGLVVALVEIIKEALKLQAVKRAEAGSLTEAEMERLGQALLELDAALERLKAEMGIAQAVTDIREGLDRAVADAVTAVLSPAAWASSRP